MAGSQQQTEKPARGRTDGGCSHQVDVFVGDSIVTVKSLTPLCCRHAVKDASFVFSPVDFKNVTSLHPVASQPVFALVEKSCYS